MAEPTDVSAPLAKRDVRFVAAVSVALAFVTRDAWLWLGLPAAALYVAAVGVLAWTTWEAR